MSPEATGSSWDCGMLCAGGAAPRGGQQTTVSNPRPQSGHKGCCIPAGHGKQGRFGVQMESFALGAREAFQVLRAGSCICTEGKVQHGSFYRRLGTPSVALSLSAGREQPCAEGGCSRGH